MDFFELSNHYLDVFDVDMSYINNNYSSVDIFFIGLTHAIPLALPLSPPLLICLRRLLVQGIPAGLAGYFGTALGQTVFVSLLFFGARDLIQVWYDWEPTLYFIGILLSFRALFTFYNDFRLKALNTVNAQMLLGMALQTFSLVLLNPVSAMNTSRFLTTHEILGMETTINYCLGLFLGVFSFGCLFGFLFYFIRNWVFVLSPQPYMFLMRPINKGLVIVSLSMILSGTAKMTWQLFLQHPIESFLRSTDLIEGVLPTQSSGSAFSRQFQNFDTSILNRDRHLPVFRHFPVEKLKQRRVWLNKPPLTERQLSTIYYRYNVHIVNKISDWVTKARFTSRTPFLEKTTPEQVKRLQQVKADYLQLETLQRLPEGSKFKGSERFIQNKGKGNPETGYSNPKVSSNSKDVGEGIYFHSNLKKEETSQTPRSGDLLLSPFQYTSEGKLTNANVPF